MTDKEELLDFNVEPDVILEYLFVDKDFDPEKIKTHSESTFYDSIDIFFTGKMKNFTPDTLRRLIPLRIRARADELVFFKDRAIDLNQYKYCVLDEDKQMTEFDVLDEAFFNALKKTFKLLIVRREFPLEPFKTHKIFEDFYNFVFGVEVDEEKILENYVEPHATVEYLFIEKAEEQFKPINDDQGYLMAFMNIFFTGKFANNNLNAFKTLLLDELNYTLQESKNFNNKSVDLDDYKFYLIDNDKNATEFAVMDEQFYEALIASLRNLVIVGKNFDLAKFKHHDIFEEWFEKYSNRQ